MKKKVLLLVFLCLISIIFYASSRLITSFKPLLPHLSYLSGQNQPLSILFLLGNDTETRANGGFAGSYVKATVLNKEIKDLDFQDIYVPNGQLSGFVKPPEPVQQAFGHGTWQLANADWDPDFPTTATSIRWFLEKGKEINPDILGIINLSTIKNILNVVGPVTISDQNTTITPENLYLYLQGKAEVNFFPGSTQKKDALHTVGTATFKKLLALPLHKKVRIAQIIYTELKNQNIVLHSSKESFQNFLVSQNMAGVYQPKQTHDNYGLVEVNLGANKSNAYVTRQTNHQVFLEDNQIKHNVQINLQNSSPEANPNPPLHYGGNYIAYMRIYLPSTASNIEINTSEVATDSSGFSIDALNNQKPSLLPLHPNSMTQIGFWHIVVHGNSSYINLKYSLPATSPANYSLTILKQNGFATSPQALKIFDQNISTNLKSSFVYLPKK